MDTDIQPRRKRRETILTISLVVILGGLFLFFMNLISLGIFMWVGAIIIAMGLIGFLHYVLWGQTMTENTAGEREEAELRQRLNLDREDWE
ncbi:MAG: hypothetical protein U0793_33220 [Gemmataceae bacterium]